MLTLLGLVPGFLLANQIPINAKLGLVLASPYRAIFWSMFISLLFASATLLIWPVAIPNWGQIIATEPWWIWFGGVMVMIFAISNTFLFVKLGAVQAVLLPILGQILMSTLIDTFGWFGAPQLGLPLIKVGGVVLMIVGVFIAVVLANAKVAQLEERLDEKRLSTLSRTAWQTWGVLAGMMAATQQAIIGRLGQVLGSPTLAAVLAFLVGTICVLVLVLIIDKRLIPTSSQLAKHQWWYGLGGVIGAYQLLLAAFLIPKIGAGLTITLVIFGSLVGSALVAQFGWWQSIRKPVNRLQLLGMLLMVIGVIFIKIA